MDTISTLSDKFSWHRAAAIGRFYKKQLIWYTIGAGAISLLCYLLVQLTSQIGGNTMMVYTMTSFLVGGALYLSPLIFVKRDDTLMTLLPAKASEKFVFYMVVCLLIVPIVIQGVWYGTNFIFSCIDPDMNLIELMLSKVANEYMDVETLGTNMKVMSVISGISQTFAIIVTVLFSVVYFKNHRALYGILLSIAVVLFVGFASGIAGAVIVLSNTEMITKLDPDELASWMMPQMMPFIWVMYGVLTVYGLFMARLIYRRLSRQQIAS